MVTEWPSIGKIAAHSAYEMFSWYKYLTVSVVFSHLGFWSGSLFLIAPFPDLCLLVLFSHSNLPQNKTHSYASRLIVDPSTFNRLEIALGRVQEQQKIRG